MSSTIEDLPSLFVYCQLDEFWSDGFNWLKSDTSGGCVTSSLSVMADKAISEILFIFFLKVVSC